VFLKGCFLFVILFDAAYSQVGADSVRHTNAPPITVTSQSFDPEIIIHPSDLRQESSLELARTTGANLLSEALRILHPSLDIRNYGSLGGISLASFRGLPAEYTSVYWEGIKITDAQKSLSDLALIDLNSVQSVGIISAANAQLIGGDVGGAGILLTTSPYNQASGLDIRSTATSYDDFSSLGEEGITLSGKAQVLSSIAISGGVTDTYSNGAYPFFQPTTGATIRRENNDAHLLNANAGAEYIIDESASVKAFTFFTRDDRGAPNAATIDNRGASDFSARQYDENYLAALSLHHAPLSYFDYSFALGYQSQYETYTIPNFSVADRYLNRMYSFVWKSRTVINEWAVAYAGIDYTKNQLFSNQNLAGNDSSISRESYAAYIAAKFQIYSNFDITPSLRTELQSDRNTPQTLPGISVQYEEPYSLLVLQASYGRIYHAPTFNELYWKVGGNPNLVPETGTSAECSAAIPIQFSQSVALSAKISGFFTGLENQIIWIEGSQGFSIPIQVQSSSSQGAEFIGELKYHYADNIQFLLKEGLSITETKNLSTDAAYYGKELPYSTPMRSSFLFEVEHHSFGNFDFTILYRGHRYTDFYNNESTKLPPVIKYDLTISTIPFDIAHAILATARLSILNIGNKQYAEIPNFPLPGRSFRFSLDFHFL